MGLNQNERHFLVRAIFFAIHSGLGKREAKLILFFKNGPNVSRGLDVSGPGTFEPSGP